MSGGASEVYRKAALDRLASPDQLDQLMEVTTPKGWIALVMLGGLLVSAILWSLVGSIPTKVNGMGILLRAGGVADIVSPTGGMVTEVTVDIGDQVRPGQVVARLEQPELTERLRSARAALGEARQQHLQRETFVTENTRLLLDQLDRERAAIESEISAAEERLTNLEERLVSQEQLVGRGLITRQALLATRDQHTATQGQLDRGLNQLRQLDVQALDIRNRDEQERMTSGFGVAEAERAVFALEEQLGRATEIESTTAGRVVEIMASRGDVIRPTEPLVNLEVADAVGASPGELTAVIYMPLTEGKKVEAGMTAQISPTTIRREEYGFMIGEIQHVSSFPATYAGMMRVLANDQLVRTLTAGGAPIAVYAGLERSRDTESGFQWSSGDGPSTQITSGTLAGVSVVIDERKPISLVIPFFKRKLGMGSGVESP